LTSESLTRVGGGNVAGSIEEDRDVDVSQDTVRVSAVQQVNNDGTDRTNGEEVHEAVVDLSDLEHPLRADRAPDQACCGSAACYLHHTGALELGVQNREETRTIVNNLRAGTSEAILVGRLAEIFDVSDHPSQHCESGTVNGCEVW